MGLICLLVLCWFELVFVLVVGCVGCGLCWLLVVLIGDCVGWCCFGWYFDGLLIVLVVLVV